MKKYIYIIILFAFIQACVEPFEAETQVFENALVVDAILTNEEIQHKVNLSRTYRFEDEASTTERNALVAIVDNLGNTYRFEETEPGTYISNDAFSAQTGVGYTLEITTSDGTIYNSTEEQFYSKSEISSLYAVRENNDFGVEGMSIYLDSSDPDGETKYYRYEYEETYKIIAPNWVPLEFKLTNYDPCALPEITYDLEVVSRQEEQRVCYNTVGSDKIIQANTTLTQNGNLKRFGVRFISEDDYILSHRYSILVKQFAQSVEAYNYYRNIQDFSSSESIFSDTQPGFLNGNVSAHDISDNRVLGFFEVASVAAKRLYFNYRDFYPIEDLPDYVLNCKPFSSLISHASYCNMLEFQGTLCPESIVERIDRNAISYFEINPRNERGLYEKCTSKYLFVQRVCGDCTELGSNVKPDFWIED